MNILLLVTSFLIIFSMGLYGFTLQSKATVTKQTYFLTFMDLERRALSGMQKNQYRKAIQKNKRAKGEAKKNEGRQEKSFNRDRKDPIDVSKLNISSLLQTPAPLSYERLYEIAAEVLRTLYAKTAVGHLAEKLSVRDFEYQILDALIAKSRSNPDLTSLLELFPDDPRLNQIFTKMMKGTKQYTISDLPKGYPPLEDFFFLTKEKQSPVSFSFASSPLLSAVFGKDLTQRILEEERKKGTPEKPISLGEEELSSLLLKESGKKPMLTDLQEILSFSMMRSPAKAYTLLDETNKISRTVREEKRKSSPPP